ncbi:MAG: DNA translocase FtsK, partial [Chloroflexota bacterium]
AASGSTLSRPSQFTRPSNAPSFPEDDDLDDDDDFDEDEVDDSDAVARLGSAAPPRPAAPPRFGQPMKRDDADEEADDADAGKPAADKRPAGDSGMSLQERMARLNQIRQGAAAQTPKRDTRPVDDEDEDDDDETAFSTAARAVDPFDRIQPGKPAADKADEQPAASKPADSASRPETDASPFRKPTFTPPAASSAAAASGTSGEKEKTDKPAAASRPEDQRPAVASTPSQPKPQARPEPAINPDDHRPQPAAQQQRPQPQGRKQWRLPDYRTLLSSGSDGEIDRDTLVQRARIIEETLQSFGAPGRVVEINTGPVITQFGVEPDYLEGRGGKKSRVKVSAIAQLDKDLQLALGAKSIRIEAPVPGKGFVGIEVPNEEASLVSLRDVMESRQFQKIAEKSALAIALGQSVDGAPVAADLASMPHLLIAGTTGSGKSVCVNAIIDSLLIRNTPEQVKFIMVDPKRVELTGYNGVPHLVAPVVVELERIVGVLKWVTREMDERYKRFSNAGARNIEDYNLHRPANEPNMPYIVVIIDELADLMMLAPDETERVITRIAALARATGIHLVIATQRPSVDVVTGLIKANFPARIAFAVAGSVDSRVILDQPGAERLLGKGDMLYMSGDSPAPLRLQGVFVSDMEINNINRFWKSQGPDVAQQKPITQLVMEDSPAEERRSVIPRGERFTMTPPPSTSGSSSPQRAFWEETAPSNPDNHSAGYGSTSVDEAGHEDELYEEAVELVRRLNKASVSLLQRRLRIGYTRAARLIDVMEAEGIVGPPTEGSKPREVLPFKK